MSAAIFAVVILLPIFAGALIPLLPFPNRTSMMVYIETAVTVTSAPVSYTHLTLPTKA